MITIHYDFTDGTEVSYIEGLKLKDNFTTNCLDFFNNDYHVDDVVIIDKQKNKLSRRLLMTKGDVSYTNKDMREAHNLQKMLKANAFNWQKHLCPEEVEKEYTKQRDIFLKSLQFILITETDHINGHLTLNHSSYTNQIRGWKNFSCLTYRISQEVFIAPINFNGIKKYLILKQN
jgi:hypothetical protein